MVFHSRCTFTAFSGYSKYKLGSFDKQLPVNRLRQTREETYPNKPIDTEAKQILFRDITHPQLSIAKLQNTTSNHLYF